MNYIQGLADRRNLEAVLPLPDMDPDEYMPDLMLEIGPVRSIGAGLVPTDWPVVAAFAQVKSLDHHDTSTLAAMCWAYFSELQAGEDPFRIPPIEREGA